MTALAWPSLRLWWAARAGRERLLIVVGAAALGLYLAIAGAAQPLVDARAEARAAIARHDAALARLAALPAGEAPAAPPDTRPASAVATATAPEFGLSILRIEPVAGGTGVVLEDAEFAAVLVWIEALERDHGLRVASLEMDRRPAPGVVAARLRLAR